MVLLLLFRNQQGIGGGEAGDHRLGLISFLVMSLHSHLPFLRSREGPFGTFQMKGQGCAPRAVRQGGPPLALARRADLWSQRQQPRARGSASVGLRPGRWEAEPEEPPTREGGTFLCPIATPTAHVQGALTDFICTRARQLWQPSAHRHG